MRKFKGKRKRGGNKGNGNGQHNQQTTHAQSGDADGDGGNAGACPAKEDLSPDLNANVDLDLTTDEKGKALTPENGGRGSGRRKTLSSQMSSSSSTSSSSSSSSMPSPSTASKSSKLPRRIQKSNSINNSVTTETSAHAQNIPSSSSLDDMKENKDLNGRDDVLNRSKRKHKSRSSNSGSNGSVGNEDSKNTIVGNQSRHDSGVEKTNCQGGGEDNSRKNRSSGRKGGKNEKGGNNRTCDVSRMDNEGVPKIVGSNDTMTEKEDKNGDECKKDDTKEVLETAVEREADNVDDKENENEEEQENYEVEGGEIEAASNEQNLSSNGMDNSSLLSFPSSSAAESSSSSSHDEQTTPEIKESLDPEAPLSSSPSQPSSSPSQPSSSPSQPSSSPSQPSLSASGLDEGKEQPVSAMPYSESNTLEENQSQNKDNEERYSIESNEGNDDNENDDDDQSVENGKHNIPSVHKGRSDANTKNEKDDKDGDDYDHVSADDNGDENTSTGTETTTIDNYDDDETICFQNVSSSSYPSSSAGDKEDEIVTLTHDDKCDDSRDNKDRNTLASSDGSDNSFDGNSGSHDGCCNNSAANNIDDSNADGDNNMCIFRENGCANNTNVVAENLVGDVGEEEEEKEHERAGESNCVVGGDRVEERIEDCDLYNEISDQCFQTEDGTCKHPIGNVDEEDHSVDCGETGKADVISNNIDNANDVDDEDSDGGVGVGFDEELHDCNAAPNFLTDLKIVETSDDDNYENNDVSDDTRIGGTCSESSSKFHKIDKDKRNHDVEVGQEENSPNITDNITNSPSLPTSPVYSLRTFTDLYSDIAIDSNENPDACTLNQTDTKEDNESTTPGDKLCVDHSPTPTSTSSPAADHEKDEKEEGDEIKIVSSGLDDNRVDNTHGRYEQNLIEDSVDDNSSADLQLNTSDFDLVEATKHDFSLSNGNAKTEKVTGEDDSSDNRLDEEVNDINSNKSLEMNKKYEDGFHTLTESPTIRLEVPSSVQTGRNGGDNTPEMAQSDIGEISEMNKADQVGVPSDYSKSRSESDKSNLSDDRNTLDNSNILDYGKAAQKNIEDKAKEEKEKGTSEVPDALEPSETTPITSPPLSSTSTITNHNTPFSATDAMNYESLRQQQQRQHDPQELQQQLNEFEAEREQHRQQIQQLQEQLQQQQEAMTRLQAHTHAQQVQANLQTTSLRTKLRKKDQELKSVKTHQENHMSVIISHLLYLEGQMQKDQKDVNCVLNEKEDIIRRQRAAIEDLTSKNYRLLQALRETHGYGVSSSENGNSRTIPNSNNKPQNVVMQNGNYSIQDHGNKVVLRGHKNSDGGGEKEKDKDSKEKKSSTGQKVRFSVMKDKLRRHKSSLELYQSEPLEPLVEGKLRYFGSEENLVDEDQQPNLYIRRRIGSDSDDRKLRYGSLVDFPPEDLREVDESVHDSPDSCFGEESTSLENIYSSDSYIYTGFPNGDSRYCSNNSNNSDSINNNTRHSTTNSFGFNELSKSRSVPQSLPTLTENDGVKRRGSNGGTPLKLTGILKERPHSLPSVENISSHPTGSATGTNNDGNGSSGSGGKVNMYPNVIPVASPPTSDSNPFKSFKNVFKRRGSKKKRSVSLGQNVNTDYQDAMKQHFKKYDLT